MARAGLDKNVVIEKAAQLANRMGLEAVTLKLLADSLHVQPPSLYNHIKGLDDRSLFSWPINPDIPVYSLCLSPANIWNEYVNPLYT